MKVLCIGRNYREHISEMNSPVPSEPVFFMKPDTSILTRNRPFFLPDNGSVIHYEVELVMRICKVGKNIQQKFASSYFDAIGIGLDLTARDIQTRCKEKGLPWLVAKGFDNAAPLGKFIEKNEFTDVNNIHFHLEKNGVTVQKSSSSEMIFNFSDIISFISKYITLKTGDLIFTGTPSGVGPIAIGDRFEAFIEGEKLLGCSIK
jgi:2-keto-4-pentenoate hydratase/2-oxohepta-3-ene-1,7-dioic acid hydratase in catechol pathway